MAIRGKHHIAHATANASPRHSPKRGLDRSPEQDHGPDLRPRWSAGDRLASGRPLRIEFGVDCTARTYACSETAADVISFGQGMSGQVLRHADTWLSLVARKGLPFQSADRDSSSRPASCAMRSHSAGQM